ncbi:MAG: SDR family oxidoreductase [Aestuariivita sp.]|nr:SDR family oxidoreductase [Aestuariivita sp.]
MHLLVIGAAGMIGRKLIEKISLNQHIGEVKLDQLTLADVVAPKHAADFAGECQTLQVDLTEERTKECLIANRPDIIIHLAAIVSGEAEIDFEKGYRVNFDGTRMLFDSIRQIADYTPRVVFASSLAVFGAPFPNKIPDDFHLTPSTSYGTQKAISELLLDDYTRRGFFDGIGIRLPTICIRPGKPNKAASGFYSSILREPLNGKEALLPVSEDLRHWFSSPRSAVAFLEHAATMDTAVLGNRRNLTMPGVSVTVREQIESLRRVAGEEAVALIRREPDLAISKIVSSWPQDFEVTRAKAAGFTAESSIDDIIAVYIEEELDDELPINS